MGPANYGKHFFLWAPLSRSFLFVRQLRLIHKLLKMVCLYEPFNFIFQGHTPIGAVPYILVEGAVPLYIPLGSIAFHGFRRSVQALIHHRIDVV